ncbi:radical SAM protein [Chitinibacteraceae bacterium HSL-7]
MEIVKISQRPESGGFFAVNWALTTKCNYRCSYCHPDLHNGKIKTPNYDVVSGFVDRVFKYCDSRGVRPFFEFGGGEVTYLKWFGDLLRLIHGRGGLVNIISNASSSLSWWEEYVPYLNGVCLSFHVEEVKDHNYFIRVAQVASASPTTNLHVNIMMLPGKFDDCLSLAHRLKENVPCAIALQPLFHGFGGGGLSGKFAYTDEQEEIMQSFSGNQLDKPIPQPRGSMLVTHADGKVVTRSSFDLLVTNSVNFQGWECSAGIENIVITFQGDIYRAWCMQDAPIGSIYDDDLVLPTVPTRCRTKICQCGIDICSSKIKSA